MTPLVIRCRGPFIFTAVAITLLLAAPSAVHAHGAGDQYGEAIIWLVVMAVVAVIALVAGGFLVVAWLVRLSRLSSEGTDREDSNGMGPTS
jgi:hypothetical protein